MVIRVSDSLIGSVIVQVQLVKFAAAQLSQLRPASGDNSPPEVPVFHIANHNSDSLVA